MFQPAQPILYDPPPANVPKYRRRRLVDELTDEDKFEAKQRKLKAEEFIELMGYNIRSPLIGNGLITCIYDRSKESPASNDARDAKRLLLADRAKADVCFFAQGMTPTSQFVTDAWNQKTSGFRGVDDALIHRGMSFDLDYRGIEVQGEGGVIEALKRCGILKYSTAAVKTPTPGHSQIHFKTLPRVYPDKLQTTCGAIIRSLGMRSPLCKTTSHLVRVGNKEKWFRDFDIVWRMGWDNGAHAWVPHDIDEQNYWLTYHEDVQAKVRGDLPLLWNDPQADQVLTICQDLERRWSQIEKVLSSFLRADQNNRGRNIHPRLPGYSDCELVYSNADAEKFTIEAAESLVKRLVRKDGRSRDFLPNSNMYEHQPIDCRPEVIDLVSSPSSPSVYIPTSVYSQYNVCVNRASMSVARSGEAGAGTPQTPEQLAERHGLILPDHDITGERNDWLMTMSRFANLYGDLHDQVFVEWWWLNIVKPFLESRTSKDLARGVSKQKKDYLSLIASTIKKTNDGRLPAMRPKSTDKEATANGIYRFIKEGFESGQITGTAFSEVSKAIDLISVAYAIHSGGIRLGSFSGVTQNWFFIHSKICESILGDKYTTVLEMLQTCLVHASNGESYPLLERSEGYTRPGFKGVPGDYRGMCKEWDLTLPEKVNGKTLQERVVEWQKVEAPVIKALTPSSGLHNAIVSGIAKPGEVSKFIANALFSLGVKSPTITDQNPKVISSFLKWFRSGIHQWALEFYLLL